MSRAYEVREASRDELPGVLSVQRDGFMRVAQSLRLPEEVLPPLNETLEDLQVLFDSGVRFFSAVSDIGVTVGTVRASAAGDTVEVGRLAVDSGWLRQGVASALMAALEAAHPQAARFIVFTGSDAIEPMTLYRKLGYGQVRREDLGHVELVWLEKANRAAGSAQAR